MWCGAGPYSPGHPAECLLLAVGGGSSSLLWGWRQSRWEKGVSLLVSTFPETSLVGGKVKKGTFLAAYAAGSLLQKSCFWKTPKALRETKIGQAWPWPAQPTPLTHPHAESTWHFGPAHMPRPAAGLTLRGKLQGGPCPRGRLNAAGMERLGPWQVWPPLPNPCTVGRLHPCPSGF